MRSGEQYNTRKILQFLLSFNGNSISSIHTDIKFLHKHEHFSFLKTGSFDYRLGPWWIGKNFEVQPRFIFKKPNFPSFSWTGKNWQVQMEQHTKISKSLWELGKTGNYSLSPTFKNPNFESMDKWRTIMSWFKFYCWK